MDEHDSTSRAQLEGPKLEGQLGLIIGAGTELGAALARELAAARMRIALVERTADALASVTRGQIPEGAEVRSFECDVTREDDVTALFDALSASWGVPDLVMHNTALAGHGPIRELEADEFEQAWRTSCYGGFLVGRAAARRMLTRGSGTIIFSGSAASLRAGEGCASLAVARFGLRALAQSLARELQPHGVHVAHFVIDGQISSEQHRDRAEREVPGALLAPRAIASTYLHLHQQHRSAWTHELDLRPWVEPF